METWKKILIGIVAFFAVVFIGGFCIYNYYIVPSYIEPALQLASKALNDTEVQSLLTDLADDLVEEGVLSQTTAKNYIRQTNKQNHTPEFDNETELDSILTEEDIHEQFLNPKSTSNPRDNESMIIAYSSNSNIGIETIKSEADYSDSEPSSYHTYSDKQSYIETNQNSDVNPTEDEDYIDTEDDNYDTDEEQTSTTSLYTRVINAMTSHERSVFYSVMTKVSVSELRTLYNAGDKEGIKLHLKSKLDEKTYKEAVSIFYKHAPLLYQK